MNESRVSFPYAKSLFLLAQQQGKLEEVTSDMKLIASVCDENPALVSLLKSPIVSHDKKKNIMDTIFKGRVTDLTFDIYTILKKKNREMFLADIAKNFVEMYKKSNNIITAKVVTSTPINDDLRNGFKQLVSTTFKNDKIELVEECDAQIIGGYVLTVGDKQINQSISGKISVLKSKFKDNPYISKL